ncbi:OmpA family protein [Cereibacter sphaeroides]|uniref:OmpA family protein n=1 Tax=Cereibacter sphaeroides TaxID=1063 RepID=UPI001F2A8117|nr:OmpA family protein [Cereibacter sphaeroides]MCE6952568.1 OmpA family protein [Cereibacter sphaeroides]
MATFAGTVAAVLIGPPAFALALDLPQPWTLAERVQENGASYRLPIGRWVEQGLPVRVIEGTVTRSAWRRDAAAGSTLDLLAPLRSSLEAEGFRTLFQCETDGCGGFDFRYATDVLPEPDMHVDLGDFRFYAGLRDTPAGPEAVSLLVSRSAASGFAQVIRVAAATGDPAPEADPAPAGMPAPPDAPEATPEPPGDSLGSRLSLGGSAVLEDLVFASGSAELAEGSYASLAELADWLAKDPARRVALVGHTDASGGLTANVALSRARAESVRDRLIARHGVAGDQVTAEGVGSLAPRAPNGTEEGRARNRRVEVMPATAG